MFSWRPTIRVGVKVNVTEDFCTRGILHTSTRVSAQNICVLESYNAVQYRRPAAQKDAINVHAHSSADGNAGDRTWCWGRRWNGVWCWSRSRCRRGCGSWCGTGGKTSCRRVQGVEVNSNVPAVSAGIPVEAVGRQPIIPARRIDETHRTERCRIKIVSWIC